MTHFESGFQVFFMGDLNYRIDIPLRDMHASRLRSEYFGVRIGLLSFFFF